MLPAGEFRLEFEPLWPGARRQGLPVRAPKARYLLRHG
jgi:hypothetical protein